MTPTTNNVEPTTSATKHLRELLDERGAKWSANDTYRLLVTSWKGASGHGWAFMEHRDGSFSKLTAYHLTPEQAIAATLGRGECHNADIGTEGYFKCSKCGTSCSVDWECSGWDVPRFCPNCGARVMEVDE